MANFHDFKSQNFAQLFKYEYASKGYNFLMFITENILIFEHLYSLLEIGNINNDDFWLEILRNYLTSFFNLNVSLLTNKLIVRSDKSLELNIGFRYRSRLNIEFKISRNYLIEVDITLHQNRIEIYVYIDNRLIKDYYNSILENRFKQE